MAKIKNQFSFGTEGKKRSKCGNCWHFLDCYQRLGQTQDRNIICRYCGTYNPISVPKIDRVNGQIGVWFGPNDSIWTAVPELEN